MPPTYNDMVAVPVWLKQADKILAQIHDNYPTCKSRGVKETSYLVHLKVGGKAC